MITDPIPIAYQGHQRPLRPAGSTYLKGRVPQPMSTMIAYLHTAPTNQHLSHNPATVFGKEIRRKYLTAQ